ncbi:hypothetical protein ElyMa_005635800 [Elysia marginata]|uniref:Uncharacterized protein n=1 Tax=Elysia marginata TaxID=1093978 RepID=A0AAV4F9E6_9GAST|nr:hypothetical protein ElyMa_005635800 [Elysia marginata]
MTFQRSGISTSFHNWEFLISNLWLSRSIASVPPPMLTDLINWRPVVYDCLLTTTTWLYPHIASAVKQAKPSCRDGPQVNNKAQGRRACNKARGRRGMQQSAREEGHAFVAPCLHLHAYRFHRYGGWPSGNRRPLCL